MKLQSHPYARKFWGSPIPKFHKQNLIFGNIRATLENAHSISQQGLQLNAHLNTPGEARLGDQTNPTVPSASPTACLSQSHPKKDAIANALNGLVGFLQSSRNQSKQLHAKEASQHEALSDFKISPSDINAQIFTSIREEDLQPEWLHQQINKMNN
ncbi:hypothetical protein MJO29_004672 [Puccinia striiformis f. sp. tritici]|nr:hypothetical protein MJO29_004672 [Puccinia striiformis f. sp. tritici]